MEGALNVSSRALDVYHHPVRALAYDCKSMGFSETDHGRIVLFCRTKFVGKLLHTQEVVVVGTARVVEVLEQTVKLVLVSQWQRKGETDSLLGWKVTD
jgi:hypothetical protein